MCGLSLLLRDVLFRVLSFSSLLKNKHFKLNSNSILNLRARGLLVVPDPLERALNRKQEDLIGSYMISRDPLWEVHVS